VHSTPSLISPDRHPLLLYVPKLEVRVQDIRPRRDPPLESKGGSAMSASAMSAVRNVCVSRPAARHDLDEWLTPDAYTSLLKPM